MMPSGKRTEGLGIVHCAKKLNSDLPGSAQPTEVLSQGVIRYLLVTGRGSSMKGPGKTCSGHSNSSQAGIHPGGKQLWGKGTLMSVVQPSRRQDGQEAKLKEWYLTVRLGLGSRKFRNQNMEVGGSGLI